MKGLILCGGLGTRLWPVTLSLPKQLIPLAGKPLLYYIIDSLIQADINEIGIVVGNNEEIFKDALIKKYSNKNIKFEFIKQNMPLGLAHAVNVSENFIKDEEFIMILGDNFYEIDILEVINNYYDKKSNCHILLKEVDEPRRFGIAEVYNGIIRDVIEKPKNPPSNLAITGIYIFDKYIFKACKQIKPSWRGEYEITDAIRWLLNRDYKVTYDTIKGIWKDLGKLEDILQANRYKLRSINCEINGVVDNTSKIKGNIILGSNSKVLNCAINGPVYIGNNTEIKDSIIGPYTSIYNGVVIEGSNIENSIVLDNCKITKMGSKIISSIIEKDCIIEMNQADNEYNQFLLGRKSKIIIGRKGEGS